MHGDVLCVVVVKRGQLSRQIEIMLPLVPFVSQSILVHGNLHIDSIFSLLSVLLIVRSGTLVVPQSRIVSVRLNVDQHVY